MNALVSLLDHEHAEAVRSIWSELDTTFGVRVRYTKPFTHFSYHVAADDYDLDLLEPVLGEVAARHEPFTVRTSGLGVFTGTEPIIFMQVVRSAALDRLHHDIWEHCTPRFGVGLPYYSPDAWVPHVTLAQGPRTRSQLPEITRTLGERDLAWDIPVDSLAIIEDGGPDRGLRHTVELGG
jgi:2'-5' RNA ligase